jgi:hypothetical protein
MGLKLLGPGALTDCERAAATEPKHAGLTTGRLPHPRQVTPLPQALSAETHWLSTNWPRLCGGIGTRPTWTTPHTSLVRVAASTTTGQLAE